MGLRCVSLFERAIPEPSKTSSKDQKPGFTSKVTKEEWESDEPILATRSGSPG